MPDLGNDNPFASPQQLSEEGEIRLADGRSYQISGMQLYGTSNVDLRDICWLTGATTDLVGSEEFKATVLPAWSTWLFWGWLAALIILDQQDFAFGLQMLAFSVLMLAFPVAYGLLALIAGARFCIRAGNSAASMRALKHARISKWCHVILLTCLVPAFLLVLTSDSDSMGLFLFGALAIWGLTTLVLSRRLKAQRFQPTVTRYNDRLFIVSGLTREFLAAAKQSQHDRVDVDTLAPPSQITGIR